MILIGRNNPRNIYVAVEPPSGENYGMLKSLKGKYKILKVLMLIT
jgi:hypothetical protein